jgi:hypothetical protein
VFDSKCLTEVPVDNYYYELSFCEYNPEVELQTPVLAEQLFCAEHHSEPFRKK